jgi:hypothetical protein
LVKKESLLIKEIIRGNIEWDYLVKYLMVYLGMVQKIDLKKI